MEIISDYKKGTTIVMQFSHKESNKDQIGGN